MMRAQIVIVAGGTGGHVFPGITVGEKLRANGVSIAWIGTQQGLEQGILKRHDIPFFAIDFVGVRRKHIGLWLMLPYRLLRALWQAIRILYQLRPRCVLGMGGFASLPGGIAAWLMRIPLVIHEQNTVAGSSNRILMRMARTVLQGFPHTFAPAADAEHVGLPVRDAIFATATTRPNNRSPLQLLVLGGSQGARPLNHLLPVAIAALPTQMRPAIWHQCGFADYEQLIQSYRDLGIKAKVTAFIDAIEDAYQYADLVVSRAGAMTIGELMAAGCASILIPFPQATDDHQRTNAAWIEKCGGAWIVEQSAGATALAAKLQQLLSHPSIRQRMQESARQQAKNNAALRIGEVCLGVAQ